MGHIVIEREIGNGPNTNLNGGIGLKFKRFSNTILTNYWCATSEW